MFFTVCNKWRNLLKGVTCIFEDKEFHIISNGKMPIEQFQEIVKDIEPYVTAIHLREKQKTARELYEMVQQLISANIPLAKIIINDRLDVALTAKAGGVQLAFHSLEPGVVKENFPQIRIGSSIHSYQEGVAAKVNRADYVIYGHIFPSHSKPGMAPKGLEELSRITQLDIPVIAIGGITQENAARVIQAGAQGIAVMSGVLNAGDPLAAVKSYIKVLKNGGGKSGEFS
ncbi:thiamine phosphate synthase [Neobacillus sp. 19]|uniref:thiamine phosphate synthase n=1 Tax=Neobacillus sp. 19 TaxID=3394458 RepID=UPI003BF6E5D4